MGKSIGFLVIATNKYVAFVPPLIASLDTHFLPGWERMVHLFTDRSVDATPGVCVHAIGHEPWPMPTLKRYHHFDDAREALARHDFLFYLDADMRVVGPVGEEILPDASGNGLVAVEHPGFIERDVPQGWLDRCLRKVHLPHRVCRWRPRGTFESNPTSRAYVPDDYRGRYFCGGVNGGTSAAFLAMAKEIRGRVDEDLAHEYTAIWHDESHLNRYLMEHPPKAMSASYCYPESWKLPLERKILALDKDHSAFRD